MAIYKQQNYARQTIAARDGDIFEDCNLVQETARTMICDGVDGLTFKNCNLFNCIVPKDAEVVDCLYNPSDDPDNPLQRDIIDEEPVELSPDEQFQQGVDALISQCYPDSDVQATMKETLDESIRTAISVRPPAPIKRIG